MYSWMPTGGFGFAGCPDPRYFLIDWISYSRLYDIAHMVITFNELRSDVALNSGATLDRIRQVIWPLAQNCTGSIGELSCEKLFPHPLCLCVFYACLVFLAVAPTANI